MMESTMARSLVWRRRVIFWRSELPARSRLWWARHWPPAVAEQYDRERKFWRVKHDEVWDAAVGLGVEDVLGAQVRKDRGYALDEDDLALLGYTRAWGLRERVRERMAAEGIPVGTDDPTLLATAQIVALRAALTEAERRGDEWFRATDVLHERANNAEMALTAAEARVTEAQGMHAEAFRIGVDWQNRAVAAEARVRTLEGAVFRVHNLSLLPFDDNDRRAISEACRAVLAGSQAEAEKVWTVRKAAPMCAVCDSNDPLDRWDTAEGLCTNDNFHGLAGSQGTPEPELCPSGLTEPHWNPGLGPCLHPSHLSAKARGAAGDTETPDLVSAEAKALKERIGWTLPAPDRCPTCDYILRGRRWGNEACCDPWHTEKETP